MLLLHSYRSVLGCMVSRWFTTTKVLMFPLRYFRDKTPSFYRIISLTSHWLELSHMAMLAAKEGGKSIFLQAAKMLSLGKKGRLDTRGQPGSSFFRACDKLFQMLS